jgi:PhzF family phenazine biosynthesis protein
MRVAIFQIDAFTNTRFSGNPAAVMPLDRFPEDAVMQAIAAENNLSETAFIVPFGDDYQLRWFTPTLEVPLCGHATLASAAAVMERIHPQRQDVVFHTASGALPVRRTSRGYVMDFPARRSYPTNSPPALAKALGTTPLEVLADKFNYLVVVDNAHTVRALAPNLAEVAALDRAGVIVTAAGEGGYDLVSRYFAPAKGIPEDPVTGGAHCTLAPYWADRLRKTELRASQVSRRGGEMVCRLKQDRVELEGACVFYMEGFADI